MTQLKFGKLTYISETPYEFNKGIRIEYGEEIPLELHKFYYPNKNSLSAVSNCQFYCSHPFQFNDLTDSNPLSFNFKDLKFENYVPYFQNIVDEEELKKMYEEDKKIGFPNFRNIFFSLLTQKLGTICLTPNEMNDLMWGHYASDSGFRIKYDSKKLIDSINKINDQDCLVFPINYIDNKLNVDVNIYGFHIPLLLDFSTKVKHWEYENEWRIIISKNDMSVPHSQITPYVQDYNGKDDRLVSYDKESILEIVLGMNFFNGKKVSTIEYISNTEKMITVEDKDLIDFLSFISTNFEDKIVHAGIFFDDAESIYKGTIPMKRSIEKIKIHQVEHNKFMLIRVNPGYLRKF